MNVHMQVNSPELRKQYEAHKARQKRLAGVMRRAMWKPSAPLALDANAHVDAWKVHLARKAAARPKRERVILGRPADAHVATFKLYRDLKDDSACDRTYVEDVIREVCLFYKVSRADLISQRRTATVVKPRQVGMYLAKTLTLRSLPEIGRRFGGRDHTTVLHAVRKMGALVEQDPALAADVATITRNVVGGLS